MAFVGVACLSSARSHGLGPTREIVELCQRGDRSVGQVARDFDLTETALREWVKQAERDAGTRHDGLSTAERNVRESHES